MNYTEEQNNELEALEAIYSNELNVISRKPFAKFTVLVKSEPNGDEQNEQYLDQIYEVLLLFNLNASYPDEVPQIEIQESVNLEESDEQELIELLELNAKSSVGMVMIFTLVSVAIEWINQKSDQKKKEFKESLERKEREIEEMELKKFEGTRVTVESFMAWRSKFDAQMDQLNKKELANKLELSKKMTGRKLFETNKSLIESDLQFLDENVDDVDFDVKVDESLFQDLDDLDLEEDDNNR